MMGPEHNEWTFEDLAVCYRTGRSHFIRKEGRRNITSFKEGIKTRVGEFEISVWRRHIQETIKRNEEQELQQQLLTWEKEHNYSRRPEKELELHALELHAMRIFNDRQWVAYVPFNKRFRPEELAKATLTWIETPCCKRPGEVTKEQLERAVRMDYQIFCPHCGRLTAYRICSSEQN